MTNQATMVFRSIRRRCLFSQLRWWNILTFDAYFDRFVYDEDFVNAPEVGYNRRMSRGNLINSISEFYPGAIVVEYYFAGFDPRYEGMDWRSLSLVFENEDDTWHLVGIVHGAWTI